MGTTEQKAIVVWGIDGIALVQAINNLLTSGYNGRDVLQIQSLSVVQTAERLEAFVLAEVLV